MSYDHKAIENKWQKRWEKEGAFVVGDKVKADKKKYILDMFPYPSGAGLHVGHPEGYTATDIYSRFLRMNGYQILHPMGWDAFGLPAENYAIKSGIHPKESTGQNIKTFTRQIKSLGFSYDWSREVNTSSPDYYRWTQWLFLQLYKAGLAYKKAAPVNWCPDCQTVLANEQVQDGKCERCGTVVVQKNLEQWFFKITGSNSELRIQNSEIRERVKSYPERLLDNLDELDWPEPIKTMQRNWIGKSDGAEIEFQVSSFKFQEKINFVLLHGFKGNSKGIFFPWLKEEIEKRGFKVTAPDLPNPERPTEEEQVGYVLKNVTFDGNTVLLGHSLGAVVAMKVVEKLGHKITGLVLAGGFSSPKFKDKVRPFHNTFDWNFDFKKIKDSVGFVKVLSDKNDYAIRIDQGRFLHDNLGGELIETIGQEEHFTASEEPMILDSLVPSIRVFTTRPDTLYGATYMVLAPEHGLVHELKSHIENWGEVEKYIKKAAGKSELARTDLAKEKTGVELKGVKAVNPANGEEIPIWIADYVLATYGTGAIMAVPAHDERDWEFAKKFNLPIRQVIEPVLTQSIEPGKVIEGLPFDDRDAIIAIVKHWSEDRYIGLKWKEVAWGTFITGGIEPGQTAEEAAIMEIREETGYLNPKLVKDFGMVHSKFYHVPKKTNRFSHSRILYFELTDGSNERISEIEQAKHEALWFSKNELERFITADSHHYSLRLFQDEGAYEGMGLVVNSGEFDGMDSEEAKWKITDKVGGKRKVQYKLRDWLISRQRYWGAPIPIIYCDECGEQAVPEKDLPVELPDDVDFRPKGESPLARSKSFHKVKCPKCGQPARRESDTMDTFVDSSWYFLRYTDPQNKKEFADQDKIKTWLPVDTYVGGAEHAVLHLMYARFITMALRDLGYIDFDEPFLQLRNQGLILGPDGQKMSKSRGNVINPDEVIEKLGADTMRIYEMFMGPLEDAKPWDTNGIVGVRRFLDRVFESYKFQVTSYKTEESKNTITRELNRLIKKVEDDIQSFDFNTAVSQFMIFVNAVYKVGEISKEHLEKFLKVLSPFAPHLANELWEKLGHKDLIEKESWPKYDKKFLVEGEIIYVVQVNGKARGQVRAAAEAGEKEVIKAAKADEKLAKYLGGKEVGKTIFVRGKLVNFVTNIK